MTNKNLYDDDGPTLAELVCATAEIISQDGGKEIRRYQIAKVKEYILTMARQRNISVTELALNGLHGCFEDALFDQAVN